jgi:hypothetical protein
MVAIDDAVAAVRVRRDDMAAGDDLTVVMPKGSAKLEDRRVLMRGRKHPMTFDTSGISCA